MPRMAAHGPMDGRRRAGGAAKGPARETERGAGIPAEKSVLISECRDTLPPPQREAILLAYYHGMSHAEISRSLRVPIGTVKSRVRRGLAAIKDMIAR